MSDDVYYFDPKAPRPFGVHVIQAINRVFFESAMNRQKEEEMKKKTVAKKKTALKSVKQGTKAAKAKYKARRK